MTQRYIYDRRILIITKNPAKKDHLNYLSSVLDSMRLKSKKRTVASINEGPVFKLGEIRRAFFTLIIIESVEILDQIERKRLKYLLDFCRNFKIGIISLLDDSYTKKTFIKVIKIKSLRLSDCHYGNPEPLLFKLTKYTNSNIPIEQAPIDNVPVIIHGTAGFPVVSCTGYDLMTVINEENIRKVFVTTNWHHLPTLKTLLIDALSYASYNRIKINTSRFIQIDIDDIFVGPTGKRMKSADVQELVRFQDDMNREYFNMSENLFKFNLGFSGYYYQHGNLEENLADELLISTLHEC